MDLYLQHKSDDYWKVRVQNVPKTKMKGLYVAGKEGDIKIDIERSFLHISGYRKFVFKRRCLENVSYLP